MSLHVVICVVFVFVCYPIPCLSVDNVSVTTTVPPTPTTQPITSHPTPTRLIPRAAPDPKGNTHTPFYSASAISARPSLLSFGVFHSLTHLMTLRWLCTHIHPHTCIHFPLQPSFALHLHDCTCPQVLGVHKHPSPPSLSLSYHLLFDAPYTHIVQSAFVYLWGCPCVCFERRVVSCWLVSTEDKSALRVEENWQHPAGFSWLTLASGGREDDAPQQTRLHTHSHTHKHTRIQRVRMNWRKKDQESRWFSNRFLPDECCTAGEIKSAWLHSAIPFSIPSAALCLLPLRRDEARETLHFSWSFLPLPPAAGGSCLPAGHMS